uniref:HTH OST-type domain-containing protein n=1 Tax=Clastoptera arizonana TaxID=38151 RepID=A0A1B6CRM9_9HEMI
MVEDKDRVISNLRACIISSKGGLPFSHLQKEFQFMIGEPIPFKKFGFSSLEAFLRGIPDFHIFQNHSGELMVEAKVKEESAHVSSLIRRQKSDSKRRFMRPIAPARKPFIKEAWIPPLISRRRPQKVPLSITLNNNNQGNSSKNSRMVMVGAGHYSPPTSPVQASYPTSKPKHNLPPRLQKKTFSQEFSANLLSHPLNVDTDYASEARGKEDYENMDLAGSYYQSRQKNETIQLAEGHLNAFHPNDEYDVYGKHIAHKLRSLKGNQAIFAQKLINDVIFEGELEALTKDYKICESQLSYPLDYNIYQQFYP